MNESFEQQDGDSELEQQEETLKIRALNDGFRRSFTRGNIFLTPGTSALGATTLGKAFQAIQTFDDFNPGNDPWGIHDFGEVNIDGTRIWFKIDAYDQNLEYGSPDPTDPAVTVRVMTVYLPEEH